MALVPCRECGKEVSRVAAACPNCGAPYPSKATWKGYWGINWKSRTTVFGLPLVHVAFGLNEYRRPMVAKGVIAIGQFAVGVITIAQFGIGLLFGLGQFLVGTVVVAQFAFAGLIGIGQIASGILAIGQFVVGLYGLCQAGFAKYMWSPTRTDMEAVALFHTIYERILHLLGG